MREKISTIVSSTVKIMNGRRGFHQLILIIKKISTPAIFWNVEITNFWVVILFQRQYKVKIIF